MSIKVMSLVWEMDGLNSSELLVMLALADFANDDGRSIRPSMPTIAAKARLSVVQARRIIHKLIADGHLELIETGGWSGKRNRPNEYRIILRGTLTHERTGTHKVRGHVLSKREYGTRADERTGTLIDDSTVLSPMRDDPLIDPPIDPPKEENNPSSSLIDAAWQNHYGEPMPAKIKASIEKLQSECSVAAIVHGIDAAAANGVRNYAYIAECARNYVPPANERIRYSQWDTEFTGGSK